jgi:hypothetical protein
MVVLMVVRMVVRMVMLMVVLMLVVVMMMRHAVGMRVVMLMVVLMVMLMRVVIIVLMLMLLPMRVRIGIRILVRMAVTADAVLMIFVVPVLVIRVSPLLMIALVRVFVVGIVRVARWLRMAVAPVAIGGLPQLVIPAVMPSVLGSVGAVAALLPGQRGLWLTHRAALAPGTLVQRLGHAGTPPASACRAARESQRTTAMAAPKPLSMLTTVTPAAQLDSMPSSAVKPPSEAP